jgi:hypothetical protein
MNHLEQLVSEWLQFKGYFVKSCMSVGPRQRGGFEGELDVVGLHVPKQHLIHVECSLDADSKEDREKRFRPKLERGRKYTRGLFPGLTVPSDLDQVVLLQFATHRSGSVIGGARLVTGRELVREIFDGLAHTSPAKGAVPSTFPLLRTLQLAADARTTPSAPSHRLIR